MLFIISAFRKMKYFCKPMKIRNHIIPVLIALLLAAAGCKDSTEEQARKKGVEIYFREYVHDYGEIDQDSDGTWTFSFSNIGEKAFVINRVRSTCGCTVPDWPREPVEPGSEGSITVKYNTATPGTFMKSLFVYSSAVNSPVKLQIKGKVIPKEE